MSEAPAFTLVAINGKRIKPVDMSPWMIQLGEAMTANEAERSTAKSPHYAPIGADDA